MAPRVDNRADQSGSVRTAVNSRGAIWIRECSGVRRYLVLRLQDDPNYVLAGVLPTSWKPRNSKLKHALSIPSKRSITNGATFEHGQGEVDLSMIANWL